MNVFTQTSNGYEVNVITEFDFDRSNPLQTEYVFAYHIEIINRFASRSRLISRKWYIQDENEQVKVVEGPGVVGQHPELSFGQKFKYTSFCPLNTLTGKMWGHFVMLSDDGNKFKVETPVFHFSIPQEFLEG